MVDAFSAPDPFKNLRHLGGTRAARHVNAFMRRANVFKPGGAVGRRYPTATAARRADFARVVRADNSATDFQYPIKGARRQVKGARSRTRVISRSWVSKS